MYEQHKSNINVNSFIDKIVVLSSSNWVKYIFYRILLNIELIIFMATLKDLFVPQEVKDPDGEQNTRRNDTNIFKMNKFIESPIANEVI